MHFFTHFQHQLIILGPTLTFSQNFSQDLASGTLLQDIQKIRHLILMQSTNQE